MAGNESKYVSRTFVRANEGECQSKIKDCIKDERHILVDRKSKKHERERGRKGDYLRENGENVTVDKKQREGPD